jgi:hypothetical protein
MPRFDGTGPLGKGPGTGRGMGRCGIFTTLCEARRPPGRVFLTLAVTGVGLVVKDAMNPEGITRKAFRRLGNILTARLREPGEEPVRTIREVEAEVLPGPRELKKRERSENDAAR